MEYPTDNILLPHNEDPWCCKNIQGMLAVLEWVLMTNLNEHPIDSFWKPYELKVNTWFNKIIQIYF